MCRLVRAIVVAYVIRPASHLDAIICFITVNQRQRGCQLPSIGVQHVVCGFLSSDWLLTESLSGIQSSSLRETEIKIALTSAVLH